MFCQRAAARPSATRQFAASSTSNPATFSRSPGKSTGHRATACAAIPALTSGQIRVAVCGACLQSQPLNPQPTRRDAHLVQTTHTAPLYRLYALPDGKRPGMARMAECGAAIEVEVWEMPGSEFCSFVNDIPAPLGIGRTLLADGSSMAGFIREDLGLNGAQDITDVWWLAYEAQSQQPAMKP